MNSLTLNTRRPFRHGIACLCASALLVTVAACDKKADATGSASPSTSSSAKPKLADLKSAYKSEIDSAPMTAPMDKRVDAFVAKVGKPVSDTGRTKIWYALDGDKCAKITIDGKDGSITEETAEKGKC